MKVFAKALHSKFAINGQLKTEIEFEYAPTFSEVYERLGFLPERFPLFDFLVIFIMLGSIFKRSLQNFINSFSLLSI